MKNVINYFYGLNINNIRMIDDNYYFAHNGKNFVFYEIKDAYFDYLASFKLNSLITNNTNYFYQIIPNKNNEVLTYNADKKYILMMCNTDQDRNFDYFDIIKTNILIDNNNKILNRLNRFNWSTLWKKKIDYFELFIEHNVNKYFELNKYYNYFIGLSENAIIYFDNTINEEKPTIYDKMVVSHKRITADSTFKQLYNPVGLVIDHPSRDLASYLKMIFFNNSYTKQNILSYLSETIRSDYSARMLISRMLFPSFFFDSFEKLIEGRIQTKDILDIIGRMKEYERYILEIYKVIRLKYQIPEIEWLKKVDYSSTLTTPNTSGTSLINIDSMPSLSVTSIMLQ